MKKHPTSNIQHRTTNDSARRHLWMLGVGCWMLDVFQFRLAAGILVLLASATFAFAQSNGVPGPTEYDKFSHFIDDRNIFNPARQPHSYTSTYRPRPPKQTHRPNGTPGIQLVGTMSYEKGMFAFFNGNSSDLRKVLPVAGKIADYTITEITTSDVQLESADKKVQINLRIGEGLQQANGKWVKAEGRDLPVAGGPADASGSAGPSAGDSSSSTPAAPVAAGEQSDIIKRLMEKRAKENQ